MPPRRFRLHTPIARLKMRSRDNLTHLRETKLKQMGVSNYPSLMSIPILLALIIVVGWLRMPVVTTKTYRPKEAFSVRPLTGWAVPADNPAAADALDVSLVYADATWAELEPVKGEYSFEAFEEKNHLAEWWAEGKRLIFRLVLDRPGKAGHKDIPEWLVEEMGGELLAGSFYETDAGGGYAPDYSNLTMRDAHYKLISALAARYDGHPGVAYIEMGSLGWNGEWTVDLQSNVEKLPLSSVSREYAWHYTNAFEDTMMLMRRPYKEVELMAVGLYNPLLGDPDATWENLASIELGGYDKQIETDLIAMPDFFVHSPSGAHIPSGADLSALLKDGGEQLRLQIRESHLEYAVLHGDMTALTADEIEILRKLGDEIGSRMWLRSARWDSRIKRGIRCKVELQFRNDGISAMHAGWPVALALFDDEQLVYCETTALNTAMIQLGETNLTTWIDIPYGIDVDVYSLRLAILDPSDGMPGVRLEMENCNEETLWTELGELRVTG